MPPLLRYMHDLEPPSTQTQAFVVSLWLLMALILPPLTCSLHQHLKTATCAPYPLSKLAETAETHSAPSEDVPEQQLASTCFPSFGEKCNFKGMRSTFPEFREHMAATSSLLEMARSSPFNSVSFLRGI